MQISAKRVLHRLHPRHESSKLRVVGSELSLRWPNITPPGIQYLTQPPWPQTDKANPFCMGDQEANNLPPSLSSTTPATGPPSSHISHQTPAKLTTHLALSGLSIFVSAIPSVFCPSCSATLPHKLLFTQDSSNDSFSQLPRKNYFPSTVHLPLLKFMYHLFIMFPCLRVCLHFKTCGRGLVLFVKDLPAYSRHLFDK